MHRQAVRRGAEGTASVSPPPHTVLAVDRSSKAREEGTEPEFAVEPPVPLEPAKEEPPKKKPARPRRKNAG
jgi:hypothetical protein